MKEPVRIWELLSPIWVVRDKDENKLAIMVRTDIGETVLVMSEQVAQHLSDEIWHGKMLCSLPGFSRSARLYCSAWL